MTTTGAPTVSRPLVYEGQRKHAPRSSVTVMRPQMMNCDGDSRRSDEQREKDVRTERYRLRRLQSTDKSRRFCAEAATSRINNDWSARRHSALTLL
jgi:hypothetical protein